MSASAHVHDHDSPAGLLSVEDARERVLSKTKVLSPLRLPLTDAHGCVTAEDIVATADLPEFASSAMDGFAVRASDVAGATPSSPVELRVVGQALIGHRPEGTVGSGESMRIATGAPIPAGADCVVPIENAIAHDEEVVRALEGPPAGTHVRPR
ncbi:MAG: gephyrin-like molybdotransferase Glp, partial [Gemmatimonadota bacterium]